MFNGFWPHYKKCVHHGEEISGPSSFSYDKGHNTNNTQAKSGFGEIDTMKILNDIFGITTRKVYFTDRFFPTAFIRLEKPTNFATVLQILNFPTILKSNGKTVGI